MNCLMICSTRGRPDRAKKMLQSFYETREDPETSICLAVSQDDEYYKKYLNEFSRELVITTPSRWIAEKMNLISTNLYPDLKYYGCVDDDHIFRTCGWDKLFKAEIEAHKGWGLVCGSDLLDPDWYKWKHPSGWIVSGNIVRLFGYMVYPRFTHVGIDHWQASLFDSAGCLYHLPGVVIEHCHANVNKAPMDSGYREVYLSETLDRAIQILNDWDLREKPADLEKLLKAINGQ